MRSPPAIALRCDGCGHMWVKQLSERAAAPRAPRGCPKCGAGELKPLGISTSDTHYFRCQSCHNLVMVKPEKP